MFRHAALLLATVLIYVASAQIVTAQSAGSDSTAARPIATAVDSTRRADSVAYVPLSTSQKLDLYVARTYSLRALFGASYAAGLAQWRHAPREWGDGISGYGRRSAAAYGGGIVRRTSEFGLAILLHEDPRYQRSNRSGFVARTGDVLLNSVTVRTDDDARRPAWSRAAAALITGFAVNSWEPKRLHSTHHALMLSLAGFLSYGSAAFTQEFTPDVRRYFYRELHIGPTQRADTLH